MSSPGSEPSHHHIASVGTYVAVWAALVFFTLLTVFVASKDFGTLNTTVALAIAVTKASMVVLIFMGLRHNTPLTKLIAVSGFIWILILFGIGMTDYLTRTWMGVPGR
jgi:cytochrome c oxidase subunit 4